MRRIDQLFTAWPFLGSRRLTAMLRAEGFPINRKRVQRPTRQMGIAALGPKPNTSKLAPGHKIYPYPLRGRAIERVNQVWRRTSPTVRSGAAFSIWWRSSTGPAVRFCRGGCRSPWTRPSASRPWRMLSLVMAGRKSSTPTRVRSSRARRSPVCLPATASPSAWTAKGLRCGKRRGRRQMG